MLVRPLGDRVELVPTLQVAQLLPTGLAQAKLALVFQPSTASFTVHTLAPRAGFEPAHLLVTIRRLARLAGAAAHDPASAATPRSLIDQWGPAWKAGIQPISRTRLSYRDLVLNCQKHTTTAAHGRLDPYSPAAALSDLSAARHTGRAPRIRTGNLMIPNHAG